MCYWVTTAAVAALYRTSGSRGSAKRTLSPPEHASSKVRAADDLAGGNIPVQCRRSWVRRRPVRNRPSPASPDAWSVSCQGLRSDGQRRVTPAASQRSQSRLMTSAGACTSTTGGQDTSCRRSHFHQHVCMHSRIAFNVRRTSGSRCICSVENSFCRPALVTKSLTHSAGLRTAICRLLWQPFCIMLLWHRAAAAATAF